jgi:phosphate transport system substrate-binding protein
MDHSPARILRGRRAFADAFTGIGSALVLLALGCGGGAERANQVVNIDGSSTVFLISAAVAETFHEEDPSIKVVVGQSGTGGGMKKFSAGEIDICDASRKMKDSEAALCKEHGVDFLELQVAFDGLAVVVNPANDWCDSLTVEQLKTIWRKESEGSVEKWSDVNPDWPAEPFKLYGPGPDSGTFDYFTEVINGEEGSSRSDYSPSENDNALVTGVAGDKGALCYFGYGYYAENKDKLKLLAIDAGDGPVTPDPEKVRSGEYHPLSRPLYLYVKKSSLSRPSVARFLNFYLDQVAELAPKVGYVAVTDEIAKQSSEALATATKADVASDSK